MKGEYVFFLLLKKFPDINSANDIMKSHTHTHTHTHTVTRTPRLYKIKIVQKNGSRCEKSKESE